MRTALLAHQGGWDEFLFAAGPIVFIGGLLWLANRRASRAARAAGETGDGTSDVTEVRSPGTPD